MQTGSTQPETPTMPRQKITTGFANRVEPKDKRTEYRDTELSGFELRVSPKGEKTFRYVYVDGSGRGAPKRTVTIGKLSEMSADEARKIAKKHALAVSQGVNPAEERRREREAITISEIWPEFLEQHMVGKGRGRRTIEEYERDFRRRIEPAFGKTKVADLTPAMVQRWHSLASAHPRRANHALAVLSSMMSFAKRVGHLTGDNPCAGVEKYKEAQRESFYSEEEVRAYLKALEAEPDPSLRMMIRLIVATGSRSTEAIHAEWSEFELSLGDGRWTIQPEKMKQRKRHTYQLPDVIVAEMIAYRDTAALRHAKWAFPNPEGLKPRNEIRHVHERIERRAGILHQAGRGLHGFRHTALTQAAEEGMSASDIQTIAGHADIQTSLKYVHRAENNPRLRKFAEKRGAMFEQAK